MTVTDVQKDPGTMTMTITTAFDAPVDQVWRVWSDPRLLERWWGPPTYPATVVEHDLSPGGTIRYYMTGPEGDRHGDGGASSRSTHRTRWSSRMASPTRVVDPTPTCQR